MWLLWLAVVKRSLVRLDYVDLLWWPGRRLSLRFLLCFGKLLVVGKAEVPLRATRVQYDKVLVQLRKRAFDDLRLDRIRLGGRIFELIVGKILDRKRLDPQRVLRRNRWLRVGILDLCLLSRHWFLNVRLFLVFLCDRRELGLRDERWVIVVVLLLLQLAAKSILGSVLCCLSEHWVRRQRVYGLRRDLLVQHQLLHQVDSLVLRFLAVRPPQIVNDEGAEAVPPHVHEGSFERWR